jgi:hypothetical protein
MLLRLSENAVASVGGFGGGGGGGCGAGGAGEEVLNVVEVIACSVHATQGAMFVGQLQQLIEDALPPTSGAPNPGAATGTVTNSIWRALQQSSLASVIRLEARGGGPGGEGGNMFCPHFVHMQARDAVARRFLLSHQVMCC